MMIQHVRRLQERKQATVDSHEPENDTQPAGEIEAPEGIEEPFTAGKASMMAWSARAGAAMRRASESGEE